MARRYMPDIYQAERVWVMDIDQSESEQMMRRLLVRKVSCRGILWRRVAGALKPSEVLGRNDCGYHL